MRKRAKFWRKILIFQFSLYENFVYARERPNLSRSMIRPYRMAQYMREDVEMVKNIILYFIQHLMDHQDEWLSREFSRRDMARVSWE